MENIIETYRSRSPFFLGDRFAYYQGGFYKFIRIITLYGMGEDESNKLMLYFEWYKTDGEIKRKTMMLSLSTVEDRISKGLMKKLDDGKEAKKPKI